MMGLGKDNSLQTWQFVGIYVRFLGCKRCHVAFCSLRRPPTVCPTLSDLSDLIFGKNAWPCVRSDDVKWVAPQKYGDVPSEMNEL